MAACKQWANKLAMRQLTFGHLSYADALMLQVRRARKIQGSFYTEDAYAEAKVPKELGLKGSLEPVP